MSKLLRLDLPAAAAECDIEHLQDVLAALEFLRADARKLAPSELGTVIEAAHNFLCAAYQYILRVEMTKQPGRD